ncbi:MAG TPA: peptidylprolyl isomerase, partial [Patescibacteria group bacterium]|nr:peptidylprolyl isomerase [Patescibacteria group bacterium]
FMIQGGDPNSKTKPKEMWGMGDRSQKNVPAEFNKTRHTRGILSAARSADPNSASSQFFICVADAPHLDGQYTAYGQVIEGMDVVDKIVNAKRDHRDNPLEKIEMKITKKEA